MPVLACQSDARDGSIVGFPPSNRSRVCRQSCRLVGTGQVERERVAQCTVRRVDVVVRERGALVRDLVREVRPSLAGYRGRSPEGISPGFGRPGAGLVLRRIHVTPA